MEMMRNHQNNMFAAPFYFINSPFKFVNVELAAVLGK